jgi:peptide/nickel transport system substrate-binding protein
MMSRRNGAAAVALIAALVLAACGGSSKSSSTNAGSQADNAAAGTPKSGGTPKTGGTLVFARSLDAEAGLNPINAPNNGSIFTIQQIFDQLVEVDGNKLAPGLAESWTHSADAKTWTFKLRDAKFSNGSPVTAQDVKFSIDRFADPKINTNYATLGSSIGTIKVIDPKTVQIKLKEVDGAFLENIAMFAAAIVPKAVVEKIGDKAFANKPIGSGPFLVDKYQRREETVLKRNPYYWRKGQPYLDEVQFKFVPDANTRTLELRSGQVDVADGIPYNQVNSLKAASGLKVEVADSLKWDSIFFDTKKKPLDDVKVRQALAYATPTDQILKTVLFGNGQVANSQIPRVKYWDESVKPYPFDPDKAKQLLSQSSAPSGFNLELQIPSGDAVEKQTAEIIKDEWGKIGVKVNIVPRDFGTMFSDWLSGKGGDAATFPGDALSSDTLSDDEIAALMYDPKAGLSSLGTFYDNPKVTQLLKDAKGTIDDNKRRQDFSQVQTIGMQDVPSVPLFFTKSVSAYRDKVNNFQTYPIGWWPLREVWMGS